MLDYDVIVIGGGASGLMASYSAGLCGAKVLLLEKNDKLGRKIYITGKGRCNVTNNSPVSEHIENTVHGANFMRSALSQFNCEDLMSLLTNSGLMLKTERGNRVFPVSDKASDVTKTLEKLIDSVGIDVKLSSEVKSVKKVDDYFIVSTANNKYTTDCVVIATGGNTYSSTGSTGDGYKFAQTFNQKVTPIKPALVPIILKDDVKELEGLSLKNVALMYDKIILQGEMLFTNNGISGPIALTMSSLICQQDIVNHEISIDFKPALTTQKLLDKFNREFVSSEFNKKSIKNYLKSLLPARFVEHFVGRITFGEQMACQTNKEERQILANLLKHFEFIIRSLDKLEYGIITSGGVDLNEIKPKTMESKLVDNLFYCGEVLDVDALTGGFNLQIAFSTGYVAGQNAGQRRKL